MSNQRQKKTVPTKTSTPVGWSRWRIGCVTILAIVAILLVAAWLLATRFAQQQVGEQLSQLGMGDVEIESVVILPDGISATGIEFEGQAGTTLKIDRLRITHPISGLIAGDEKFELITIEKPVASVDLEQLMGGNNGDGKFDLGALELPADRIEVVDAEIELFSGEQRTVLDNVDLSVVRSDAGKLKVDGSTGHFLGADWNFSGDVDQDSNSVQFRLATESGNLSSEEFLNLPMVPAGLKQSVEFSAAFGQTDLALSIEDGQPIQLSGQSQLLESTVRLPEFDFPITITSALIGVTESKLDVDSIVASTDGADSITGRARISWLDSPITINFENAFGDLDVATLRKIVVDIPEQVAGSATGNVTGQIAINADQSLNIQLSALAKTDNGSFGQLKADSTDVKVKIDSLQFDDAFALEKIAGNVVVLGHATKQPASAVFETFDLQAIGQQLGIDANCDAEFEFALPLETAEDLATWKLGVSAEADTATISSAAVEGVQIRAEIKQGLLVISNVSARTLASGQQNVDPNQVADSNTVSASVTWPLVEGGSFPDQGTITLTGKDVSPAWLMKLGQYQWELAQQNAGDGSSEDLANSEMQLAALMPQGQINFGMNLRLPVASSDKLETWAGEGQVVESNVAVGDESLVGLTTAFKLDQGVFAVTDLKGDFNSGGSITAGRTTFDIANEKIVSADLQTNDIPVAWLTRIVLANVSGANEWAKSQGAALDDLDSLAGKLSISFTADSDNPYRMKVTSDYVAWQNIRLSDIGLDAELSDTRVVIREAMAKVSAANQSLDQPAMFGSVSVNGDWYLGDDVRGAVNVEAKQLPIELFVQDSASQVMPTGNISGKLTLEQTSAKTGGLPFTINGSVKAEQLAMSNYRLKPMELEVASQKDAISITNVPSVQMKGMSLVADVTGDDFSEMTMKLELDKFQLSSLFDGASVLDSVGEEIVSVDGLATGQASFVFKLPTMQWESLGDITLVQPSVNNALLDNVKANWKLNPTDWSASAFNIDMFGGQISMAKVTVDPLDITFDVDQVELKQLAELVPGKVSAAGSVSGQLRVAANAMLDSAVEGTGDTQTDAEDPQGIEITKAGKSLGIAASFEGADVKLDQYVLGQVKAKARLSDDMIIYDAEALLIGGKLVASGQVAIDLTSESNVSKSDTPKLDTLRSDTPKLDESKSPLTVTLTNGSLSEAMRQLGQSQLRNAIDGNVSGKMQLGFNAENSLVGLGGFDVRDVRYKNRLVTKGVTSRVQLNEGVVELNQLRIDLNQGKIGGSVRLPFDSAQRGSFQFDVSRLDLAKLVEIVGDEKLRGVGLVDARINGTIGNELYGSAVLNVSQSKLLGSNSSQLRLPVRFLFRPRSGSGQIELSRSSQHILGGTVAGTASVKFGNTVSLSSKLKLSRIDTGKLAAAMGVSDAGQGELSGTLNLQGNSIRSARDLSGDFRGTLERVDAFQLPILDQLARFSDGSQFQSQEFESEEIKLQLKKGRLSVEQFNISSSLASIAVTGNGFIDGRLDLKVVARIERFNQPTLLDQIAGSPLTSLAGAPTAFLAQAANFLSNRLLFLKVRGTINRPQVLPDSSQQLREELIRYFLRGSQILPNALNLNN